MDDGAVMRPRGVLIGIVGPCSSGKSTVARALRDAGYSVREIRQEHSGVPDMWKRLTDPDMLIYLDVDPWVAARRERLQAPSSWWEEERQVRLAHARANADLYLDTSELTPEMAIAQVMDFVQNQCRVGGDEPKPAALEE